MKSIELDKIKLEIYNKAQELELGDYEIRDLLFDDVWQEHTALVKLKEWVVTDYGFEYVERLGREFDDDGSEGIDIYTIFKIKGQHIRVSGTYYSHSSDAIDVWAWEPVEQVKISVTKWKRVK